MIEILLEATGITPLVNAAISCTADKHDLRKYLQGVLFTATGHVVGTDGHVICVFRDVVTNPPERDIIVKFTKPLKPNTKTITIGGGIVKQYPSNVVDAVEIIDALYPDYTQVTQIPATPPAITSNVMSYDWQVLAKIEKLLGLCDVELHEDRLRILPHNYSDALIILMSRKTKY